jgi:hypothetical protein
MAKTYISYSRRHKEIATEISRGLQEFGHGVQTEFEAPTPEFRGILSCKAFFDPQMLLSILLVSNP